MESYIVCSVLCLAALAQHSFWDSSVLFCVSADRSLFYCSVAFRCMYKPQAGSHVLLMATWAVFSFWFLYVLYLLWLLIKLGMKSVRTCFHFFLGKYLLMELLSDRVEACLVLRKCQIFSQSGHNSHNNVWEFQLLLNTESIKF